MKKVVWLPEDNWVVVSKGQVMAQYRIEEKARFFARNMANGASELKFSVAHLVGSYAKTEVLESE